MVLAGAGVWGGGSAVVGAAVVSGGWDIGLGLVMRSWCTCRGLCGFVKWVADHLEWT